MDASQYLDRLREIAVSTECIPGLDTRDKNAIRGLVARLDEHENEIQDYERAVEFRDQVIAEVRADRTSLQERIAASEAETFTARIRHTEFANAIAVALGLKPEMEIPHDALVLRVGVLSEEIEELESEVAALTDENTKLKCELEGAMDGAAFDLETIRHKTAEVMALTAEIERLNTDIGMATKVMTKQSDDLFVAQQQTITIKGEFARCHGERQDLWKRVRELEESAGGGAEPRERSPE